MKVKDYSYETFPRYTSNIDGALELKGNKENLRCRMKDVEYQKGCMIRFLFPNTILDEERKYPLVIHVQGSGWYKQDMNDHIFDFMPIVKAGYVYAIIEYHGAPEYKYPTQVDDVIKAIEYLKENVNGDKYLDELSKRYSVNIKKADGPTLGDINPYINNRVISNDFIISIDNSCTGEIDDAISCKRLPNGNYLLGIHITDIFGYFNINSAIVKEAYDKVTTIYSNGLFIPMFPMNIAIDQASLIENRPRYADSHYYEITKHGEVVSDIIMPTIITNNKKLNYEQANKIIKEDKSRNEELLTTIESLIEVEDILQRKFQTSSLYLSNKVNTLDPSCSKVGQSAAEKIVLYTMLLENSNMAEYFYKNNYPLIYRTHSFETNYEQKKKIF